MFKNCQTKQLLYVILFIIGLCPCTKAQQKKHTVKWLGSDFCNPGISGMSPSRGISFEHNNTPKFRLSSKGNKSEIGNGTSEVDNQRIIKMKLRVPVWNSDNLKAVIGFKYNEEELIFDDDASDSPYALHQDLGTRELKSVGTNLNILKPFRGKKYLVLRAGINYSGEFKALTGINRHEFFGYSFAALLGHKFSDDREIGFGFNYSNNLGVRSIYPALLYNHNFRENWGIEALLPKKIALRHNLNEKSIVSLVSEVEGGRYFVPDVQLSPEEREDLRMEISEVKLGLSYQREIFSILWFSFDTGYRKSLDYDLVKPFIRNSDKIVESDIPGGFYANFTFFITPPKKFRK